MNNVKEECKIMLMYESHLFPFFNSLYSVVGPMPPDNGVTERCMLFTPPDSSVLCQAEKHCVSELRNTQPVGLSSSSLNELKIIINSQYCRKGKRLYVCPRFYECIDMIYIYIIYPFIEPWTYV